MRVENSIKIIQLSLFSLLLLAVSAKGRTDIIDFESGRWVFDDPDAKVVSHVSQKSLRLKYGSAYLKDVEFENGIIEVDVACDGGRCFPGILFRIQPGKNYERFWLRPHKSNLPDAIQYAPAFNGTMGWQLYRKESTAKATIPYGRWLHIKMEIAGKQARVYLDGANEPALVINDLRHGISKGSIGLTGPVDGKAFFANFGFKTDNELKFEVPPAPKTPAGMITEWQISQVFEASQINTERSPYVQELPPIKWQEASSDPSGLVDIARYVKWKRPGDAVLAKVIFHSDKDRLKKVSFGYSDEVTIFLNGNTLFSGNSAFRSRDATFSGIVGLHDAVYLNLKKGDNELLLIISETFGGWGYICQLEDMKGIAIENDN